MRTILVVVASVLLVSQASMGKNPHPLGQNPQPHPYGISGTWTGAGINSDGEYSSAGELVVTERPDGQLEGEWGAPRLLTIERGERVTPDLFQWSSLYKDGTYQARCVRKGKSLVIDWTYTFSEAGQTKGNTGTIVLVGPK
jgi:hypothetical protein